MVAPVRKRDKRPELTAKQASILAFIARYIQQQGYPPTVREIGEEMGINSPNGTHGHLKALVKKGYIANQEGLNRAIRLLEPQCCPMCGR